MATESMLVMLTTTVAGSIFRAAANAMTTAGGWKEQPLEETPQKRQ
jgi:hypothetical protein